MNRKIKRPWCAAVSHARRATWSDCQSAATAQALLCNQLDRLTRTFVAGVKQTSRDHILRRLFGGSSNILFTSRSHRLIAMESKITVTLDVHKLEHQNCNDDVGNIKFNKPVTYNVIMARWKAHTEVAITRMHSKTSSLYFPKSAADTPTDFPTARRRSYLFHKNEPI